jgi:hypothetical protein
MAHDTYLVGTVRSNRKQFPRELKDMVLEKGESAYYHTHNMIAVKYRAEKNASGNKPKVSIYIQSKLVNI